jgi:hypothetical protein
MTSKESMIARLHDDMKQLLLQKIENISLLVHVEK